MNAADREQLWAGRRIHLLGVGGAGMSAYARAARALGAQVSGSDRGPTPYLERLRSEHVLEGTIGYDARNLPSGSDVEVFYSSAVPEDNPERLAACERGLQVRPRADLLGELSALRCTIAVAGTHGKTTTCAMIVYALRGGGLDPGWMIGGTIGKDLANSHWGDGEWLVVEADESDRSMLSLSVEIAVLTNVELDHHSAYSSLAELRESFAAFLAGARRGIVVWDRPDLVELTRRPPRVEPDDPLSLRHPALTASLPADGVEVLRYDASPQLFPGGSRLRWRDREVTLRVPGAHNALNAAGALEAARLAGTEEAGAIAGIGRFEGAGRRFERLGHTISGALVVDDYAHHPTEVAETIAAARGELEPGGRLIAVFQPHLYSRTALLAGSFGRALAQADAAVVLDVYPARERAEDHPGVSGLAIARAVAEYAGGRTVMWLPRAEEAHGVLTGMLGKGDLCLVMGAGDVDGLARSLVAA